MKGIETSKPARLQDGDKQHPTNSTSPSPSGPTTSIPDPDAAKPGERQVFYILYICTHIICKKTHWLYTERAEANQRKACDVTANGIVFL